tara:strand:+ start:236 stop:439 length:204 start_codon:yes stop_codon:yes gene_type:complete
LGFIFERGAKSMKTINSLNIHDIKEIEIDSEVLEAVGRPFTVTKYRFTDDKGNVFTVNAFLKREQDQ